MNAPVPAAGPCLRSPFSSTISRALISHCGANRPGEVVWCTSRCGQLTLFAYRQRPPRFGGLPTGVGAATPEVGTEVGAPAATAGAAVGADAVAEQPTPPSPRVAPPSNCTNRR